ncbi:MAG TPA: ABC transporter permease subunit [Dehalococcoidia bacterium]|nr:ABC transporter permease subunit [Dehalococcoidia bacterium]
MSATGDVAGGAPATGPRFLPGFGVLFDKEMREARRQKRIIIFTVVMTLLLALVPVIAARTAETIPDDRARLLLTADSMDGLVGVWAGIVGYLGALMIVAATVDAIAHERALGVTAWIVTKPVARQSYLLSKIAAHALVGIVAIVVIPTAVFAALSVGLFQDVPLERIGLAAVVLSVEMIFLSTLVVALGVPLRSVMPILLIALAVWFAPVIVPLPAFERTEWTTYVLPSNLPLAAVLSAVRDRGEFAAAAVTVPMVAVGLTLLLLVAALSLFERQEL